MRMMQRVVLTTFLTVAISPVGANAAGKKAASEAPNPQCEALARDYENASKQIAMNDADNLGDDSAVRATMRESQNNGILEKARITVELMQGNKCKMPASAPSGDPYFTQALACKNAKFSQLQAATSLHLELPPECIFSNWKSEQK